MCCAARNRPQDRRGASGDRRNIPQQRQQEAQPPQRRRWNSYDTGLLSIGQGVITLSPLQAAVYTAALANGGKISDRTWSGKWSTPMGTCSTNASGSREQSPNHARFLDEVRRGMFDVVNTPRGSGREGKVAGLELYGKTGSAQVGSGATAFSRPGSSRS